MTSRLWLPTNFIAPARRWMGQLDLGTRVSVTPWARAEGSQKLARSRRTRPGQRRCPGICRHRVINEIRRRARQIVSVAGSSMAAVVGGMFAAGQLDHYRQWVLGLTQRGVLRELDPLSAPRA
jgi:hypothetical protein